MDRLRSIYKIIVYLAEVVLFLIVLLVCMGVIAHEIGVISAPALAEGFDSRGFRAVITVLIAFIFIETELRRDR